MLGIDIGTSAVKVAVVDAESGKTLANVQHPESERDIRSLSPGWAEQSPQQWWEDVVSAIKKAHLTGAYDPMKIQAIGIAYQMHGLVMVDRNKKLLRDSIIWCDSRAVDIGNEAFKVIGEEKCLQRLLNSPGNFTASKLAWIKRNEREIYDRVDKIMLPGDFIAMKMTGELTTSIAALSEGIFWDFESNSLSKDVLDYFDFSPSFIPKIQNVFSEHGQLTEKVAKEISLKPGIPISYKAGDQPNNALSLNVLHPGEVAATAGTSGVVYAVSDQIKYDRQSRVNSFAHVNYTEKEKRLGVLLNINGAGILNRWIRNIGGASLSYQQINDAAASVPPGSEGIVILPFGNGAERMLNNRTLNAHIHGVDFNRHRNAHLFRAAQEGIAFAFRYGLDIMKENGIRPQVIRAGKANMFQSDTFTQTFVNSTGIPVEFYHTEGSIGAAIGAGLGAGIYGSYHDAFRHAKMMKSVEPDQTDLFNNLFERWKAILIKHLNE